MNKQNTVLLCPRNDEESLQILKLAEAISLPTIVSRQPHGARLEKEKDLLARVMEVNPNVTDLVIVEIPGPHVEQELIDQGIDVTIIDHHRYDDLDRMKQESSLEQFLAHFSIDNHQLVALGFDPKMIAAVGAIDRGFLWELKNEDLTEDERSQAIEYYKQLAVEVGGERREKEEALADQIWSQREEHDGILILRSPEPDVSVRDSLSFLVAKAYPDDPPQTIITQGSKRIYVQESPQAKALYDRYGGFTFGRDACWGKLSDTGDLPTVDDVLAIMT